MIRIVINMIITIVCAITIEKLTLFIGSSLRGSTSAERRQGAREEPQGAQGAKRAGGQLSARGISREVQLFMHLKM